MHVQRVATIRKRALTNFIRVSKVHASTQRCVFPWQSVATVDRTLRQRPNFFRNSIKLDFFPTIDVYSLQEKIKISDSLQTTLFNMILVTSNIKKAIQ